MHATYRDGLKRVFGYIQTVAAMCPEMPSPLAEFLGGLSDRAKIYRKYLAKPEEKRRSHEAELIERAMQRDVVYIAFLIPAIAKLFRVLSEALSGYESHIPTPGGPLKVFYGADTVDPESAQLKQELFLDANDQAQALLAPLKWAAEELIPMGDDAEALARILPRGVLRNHWMMEDPGEVLKAMRGLFRQGN